MNTHSHFNIFKFGITIIWTFFIQMSFSLYSPSQWLLSSASYVLVCLPITNPNKLWTGRRCLTGRKPNYILSLFLHIQVFSLFPSACPLMRRPTFVSYSALQSVCLSFFPTYSYSSYLICKIQDEIRFFFPPFSLQAGGRASERERNRSLPARHDAERT